jgi:hypothetical protein
VIAALAVQKEITADRKIILIFPKSKSPYGDFSFFDNNGANKKHFYLKRSIIEIVIGKFKKFLGVTLSRFRSPHTAFSAIRAGL